MAESYPGWNWRDTTHFDSKDDYRTGCRNVSHCQQQQSYSGLPSPGRSNSTYFWNDSWVQAFHNEYFDFKLTSDAKIQLVFTGREGSWLCLAWSRSTSHFHLRLVKIWQVSTCGTLMKHLKSCLLACMTAALWAKRGEARWDVCYWAPLTITKNQMRHGHENRSEEDYKLS